MGTNTNELMNARNDFITNYPHFRYWKKNIVDEMVSLKPLNIYIHIPFCIQKCSYCYYMTTKYRNQSEVNSFINALLKEIKLVAQKFNLKNRPVNSVYFGGGTPALLKTDQLKQILDCLNEYFVINNAEITIESEPRLILRDKVIEYKSLGINRISIGVQSFCDDIIKLSGRNHTGEQVHKAINIINEIGDILINIDLLSGLHGETKETWDKTVDIAIRSDVQNITIYKMQTYANTVFFDKEVRKGIISLPSTNEELEFMELALDKMEISNYKLWSTFTFTKDGKYPQIYVSNIWNGEESIALGPSAFGLLNNYCYQNTNNFEMYITSLEESQLPINRSYLLSSKDLMIRDVLLGMKFQTFDCQLFYKKHGVKFSDLIPETMNELSSQNFLQIYDKTIELTKKGILYGDYVGKQISLSLKQKLGIDIYSLS